MWRLCSATLLACWCLAAWRCRRAVRCTWMGFLCR
ncbi:dispersed gene family protein 1 (DGF-1), putative, partial [Trypanosoma cruzi]